MSVKRGSGNVAGSAVFQRTVTEAVRQSKRAAQDDPGIVIPIEDVSSVLGHQAFAPRQTIPMLPLLEDVPHILASVIFGRRVSSAVASAAAKTLTFGTHLAAGGSSYDTTANVTLTSDATSVNTASTIMARDANHETQLSGLTLPGSPTSSGSNTLDTYEEGTFVSSLTLGGGSATLSASFKTLQYTRIGRTVQVQGELHVSAVSTPSGQASVKLPFGAGAGTQRSGRAAAAVLISGADATWTGTPCGQVVESTDGLVLFEFAAGNVTDVGGKLIVGTAININATYEV